MTPPAKPAPQPAVGGWHFTEWACEAFGVFAIVFVGTFAVVLVMAPGLWFDDHIHSLGLRLLIVGTLFPATGSLLSLTPIGKLSGAHFNPSVSLAFFIEKHLHWHDLIGYVVAQFLGGIVGAELAAAIAHPRVSSVNFAITSAGHGLNWFEVALIEAAMTGLLIGVIFFMVSSDRTAHLTPFVVWATITLFVWQLAPYTGVSLNTARTFGPDLTGSSWPDFAAYIIGPLGGAVLACAGWVLIRSRNTLTAKLEHDVHYRSNMRTEMPAQPAEASPHPHH